jgi:SAM-dependent methyltransferase
VIESAAVRPGERRRRYRLWLRGDDDRAWLPVGPAGRVLGIDVSAPTLARAAERLPPGLCIDLVRADATVYPFAHPAFDLLFSRFGVMFFADPARSFANLRTALRPGGRLAFVCFRNADENPWMMVPLQAAYAYVPPLPTAGPEDPGPYSLASEERIRRVLGGAGFSSIAVRPLVRCGTRLGRPRWARCSCRLRARNRAHQPRRRGAAAGDSRGRFRSDPISARHPPARVGSPTPCSSLVCLRRK